jgi:hypothetical protein
VAPRRAAGLATLLALLACATEKPPHAKTMDQVVKAMVEGLKDSAREKAGRPSDETCAALTREGDALLAAGKREQAIASYDNTRNRCIDYGPLRRQLYLARHPGAKPPPGKPAPSVYFGVLFDSQLGPDLKIADWSGYIDGIPLWEYVSEPRALGGVQELHLEVWIMGANARGPKAEATLVDIREQLVVHPSIVAQRPLLGAALVRLADNRTGAPIEQRLSFEIEVRPIKPVAELQDDPQAMMARADGLPPVMLAPSAGAALRITDPQTTMPAALRSRRFWSLQKICVLADGRVGEVTTIKPAGLDSDQLIREWVEQWKYRPYQVDGIPRRFCTPSRLEVR